MRAQAGHAIFIGTVAPDKAGHLVHLQELGADGHFHEVAVTTIAPSSGYTFDFLLGSPGMLRFRALLTGGPLNAAPPQRS